MSANDGTCRKCGVVAVWGEDYKNEVCADCQALGEEGADIWKPPFV